MVKCSIRIKEKALIAYIAAKYLRQPKMAIVIGNTIYLHGCTKKDFLQNRSWVRHELVHIRQFRRYGWLGFIFRYVLECIRKGYYNNKYEQEAREAE